MIHPLPIYEHTLLRRASGDCLRPGGDDLIAHALDHLGLPNKARVLDVGCGPGSSLDFLNRHYPFRTWGLDPSPSMLTEASRLSNQPGLIRGSAQSLPFLDSSLDAIVCNCVLSILPNPQEALTEFSRVIKPEGFLVLTDIHMDARQTNRLQIDTDCCFRGAVSQREGQGRLGEAGFQLIVWEDRSRLLTELAARIIFECGSLDDFWRQVAGKCGPAMGRDICISKPGFHLAIACRRSGPKEQEHG